MAASLLIGCATLVGCTTSVLDGHGQSGRGGQSSSASHAPSQQGPAASPTQVPTQVPTQRPAAFVDCTARAPLGQLGLPPGRAAKLRFGCATIAVPLDYADPNGRTINLQLLRIHDLDNHAHTGSLLVDPGGPGGSGIELALELVGQVADRLLTHFDLVGFDPRGVGESSPIDCQSDAQQDGYNAASPDVTTAAGYARATELAKQYADRCAARYGSTLGEYNTVQTAMDMDEIRQAVGDDRMNYLGFSYGTELGAQYIHLFPSNVRVAVLDGAVDPFDDYRQALSAQIKGFDDSYGQFATWCTTHSPCSRLGKPRAALATILAAAQRAPLPAGGARKATVNLIETGVSDALYSRSEWPTLGSALVAARAGHGAPLLTLADQYYQRYQGHYASIEDVYNVVECNDSAPGPPDAVMRATSRAWSARYPLFASSFVPQLLICQQWRARRTVPPKPTAPNTPRKVLVVGNLHDPATPYQGARDLTATLGNAQLLTWNGEGHTSYLQGSTCVDNYVTNYLVDATLPPEGTTCPR